jgi:hypothetical protein
MTTIAIKTPSDGFLGLLQHVLKHGDWSAQTKVRLEDTISLLQRPESASGFISLPSVQDFSYLKELVLLVLANGSWSADIQAKLKNSLAQLRAQTVA